MAGDATHPSASSAVDKVSSHKTKTETGAKSQARSVMVVDADESFRGQITDLIAGTGRVSSIWSFRTIEDALGVLIDGAAPDIVFLDTDLPDMSGLDGMSEMKQLCPKTEFVFITERDDHDLAFQAVCSGAAGYLLKHASADELIRRFEELRTGGAAIDARINRRILRMCAERIGPRIDYGLTDREREILKMMVNGLTNKRMAASLFLSYHTIDTHIKNIYHKLHVHSRAGAVVKAIRENLI